MNEPEKEAEAGANGVIKAAPNAATLRNRTSGERGNANAFSRTENPSVPPHSRVATQTLEAMSYRLHVLTRAGEELFLKPINKSRLR
jgi:hypothetical protein